MPTKEFHLVLFTSEFPYGKGETYLESEIIYLAQAFSEVVIISNAEHLSDIRSVPENVKVFNRKYGLTSIQKLLSYSGILRREFWEELYFVKNQYKIKASKTIVNTILQSIFKSFLVEQFIKNHLPKYLEPKNTLFYSYWADDNAVSLALMKSRGFTFKVISRAHRWDVYFEKNGSGYLPFRKALSENLTAIYFVAQNGLDYFNTKLGFTSGNTYLARLGVYPLQRYNHDNNETGLDVLSCSFIIDRKRVHKIAEALSFLGNKISVKWTHIGSGPGMELLQKTCNEICKRSPNIRIELTGSMSNKEVKDYYIKNYIDLFVNVSESEGIPVSIMEAMSAGVPCLATDVDGVSEIVREGVNGCLIPLTDDAKEISDALVKFYEMPVANKKLLRQGAFETWEKYYNAEKNYKSFVESITALLNNCSGR